MTAEDRSRPPGNRPAAARDPVGLLGKYLKPSPPRRSSLFKDTRNERTQCGLLNRPHSTHASHLNRTVLYKLYSSCEQRRASLRAFRSPILTFAHVSVSERPWQTNHLQGKGAIPCNSHQDSKQTPGGPSSDARHLPEPFPPISSQILPTALWGMHGCHHPHLTDEETVAHTHRYLAQVHSLSAKPGRYSLSGSRKPPLWI